MRLKRPGEGCWAIWTRCRWFSVEGLRIRLWIFHYHTGISKRYSERTLPGTGDAGRRELRRGIPWPRPRTASTSFSRCRLLRGLKDFSTSTVPRRILSIWARAFLEEAEI